MYISLLVLGILLTAGGFVTIGFGVPINAFSLGNTLILAGTTAVTGGLVLIGLAAAVRQLNRIAMALKAGQRLGRTADLVEMPSTCAADRSHDAGFGLRAAARGEGSRVQTARVQGSRTQTAGSWHAATSGAALSRALHAQAARAPPGRDAPSAVAVGRSAGSARLAA